MLILIIYAVEDRTREPEGQRLSSIAIRTASRTVLQSIRLNVSGTFQLTVTMFNN